jgi:hypothetical protein
MSKTIDRTDRENEGREAEDFREYTWEPKDILNGSASFNGKRRRYIAMSSRGAKDADNWMRKRQEGWRPVDPTEDPEFALDVADNMSQVERGGGLVLCEMPEPKAKARERYFDENRSGRADAVNAQMAAGMGDRYVPFLNPERHATEEVLERAK